MGLDKKKCLPTPSYIFFWNRPLLIFFLSKFLFLFLQYVRIQIKTAILAENKNSHTSEDMPECQ